MASESLQFLFDDELGAAGVMMQHHGQSGGGKIVGALDGKEDNSTTGIKLAPMLADMQGNANY